MTREVGIFSIPPANDANKREYSRTCPKDTSLTNDFEGATACSSIHTRNLNTNVWHEQIRSRCSPFTRILNDSRLFASFAGYV